MNEKVEIEEIKGRPMLNWVGKKPLKLINSYPMQAIEVFDPQATISTLGKANYEDLSSDWRNLIIHGENKDVFASLISKGFRHKVDLIYIDPPFDSNANYVRKVQLRGMKEKIEGEGYAIGEQLQYTDIWENDNYLQFMYERLILLKELLSHEGFIFLHCDYHRGHYLKLIMDEIFEPDNFRNEIVVKRVQKNFVEGEKINCR